MSTPAINDDEPVPTNPRPARVIDSQTTFTIYDQATGRVRVTGHCPASMVGIQQHDADQAIMLGRLDYRTEYVDVTATPPVGKARPVLAGFDKLAIKADGVDTASLVLPIACTVTVDGVDHASPAETLTFTADSPGVYAFVINAFPYQDFTAEVTAA